MGVLGKTFALDGLGICCQSRFGNACAVAMSTETYGNNGCVVGQFVWGVAM